MRSSLFGLPYRDGWLAFAGKCAIIQSVCILWKEDDDYMLKRWICLLAALLLPAASLADALPITLEPLTPPPEENYLSDTQYEDETLSVRLETIRYAGSDCHLAWVTIADPSQLRTAVSTDPAKLRRQTTSGQHTTSYMAEANGAVVAINGDWFSGRNKGYIMRMGTVIRDVHTDMRDDCLIDSEGNFHLIISPTEEARQAVLDQYTIWNVLSFGPAYVVDGELVEIRKDYPFRRNGQTPRTVIGQTGELSYVMVVVDGRLKDSPGLTQPEVGELMLSLGCQQAFGLDGGGTSTLTFHNERVNQLMGKYERKISDMIYFASGLSTVREE